MQTATSGTESKSLDLSICVHHYTLRAPCPKGQGTVILYPTDPILGGLVLSNQQIVCRRQHPSNGITPMHGPGPSRRGSHLSNVSRM